MGKDNRGIQLVVTAKMLRRPGDRLTKSRRNNLRIAAIKVRSKILRIQCGRCNHCGSFISFSPGPVTEQATIDHIVPLSRGGSSHFTNLQILCNGCNNAKGSELVVVSTP